MIRGIAAGPPVATLGRMVGWDPLPLTVREARTAAAALRLPTPSPSHGNGRGEVLVEVRGLRASYGDTEVIRDLNLDLWKGSVVAVMGMGTSSPVA